MIRDAVKNGIATTEIDLENVEENVRSKMYDPTYSQGHLCAAPKSHGLCCKFLCVMLELCA